MKNSMCIFVVLLLSLNSSLAFSVPMSEREKAFVKDYEAIFNKYSDFESKTFKIEGNSHSTKSIQLEVVTNPPLIPNNKIYYIYGFVKDKNENAYVAEINIGNSKYYFSFVNKVETTRGKANLSKLKLNEGISIIGRLVNLIPYKTVFGEQKKMPFFQALHVEQCQPKKYWDRNYCAIYDD